jgi:hypothetical protein
MNYYNAIVFFKPETNKKVRKYRNISNLPNFIRFVQGLDAWYINFYDAKSRNFYKRMYLD